MAQGMPTRIKKGVWHCFLMLTAMNFAMGALLLLGTELRCVPMFAHKPGRRKSCSIPKIICSRLCRFISFWGAACLPHRDPERGQYLVRRSAARVIELAARILCASVLSIPFGYRAVCFATPFAWLTALSLLIPVYIVLIRKLVGGQSTQTKA